jgi:hypothetical protein
MAQCRDSEVVRFDAAAFAIAQLVGVRSAYGAILSAA